MLSLVALVVFAGDLRGATGTDVNVHFIRREALFPSSASGKDRGGRAVPPSPRQAKARKGEISVDAMADFSNIPAGPAEPAAPDAGDLGGDVQGPRDDAGAYTAMVGVSAGGAAVPAVAGVAVDTAGAAAAFGAGGHLHKHPDRSRPQRQQSGVVDMPGSTAMGAMGVEPMEANDEGIQENVDVPGSRSAKVLSSMPLDIGDVMRDLATQVEVASEAAGDKIGPLIRFDKNASLGLDEEFRLKQIVSRTAKELRVELLDRSNLLRLFCVPLTAMVLLGCLGVYYAFTSTSLKVPFYGKMKHNGQITCESAVPEALCEAFLQPPIKVCLRIIGHQPESGAVERYARQLGWKKTGIAFDTSIDLKSFIACGSSTRDQDLEAVKEFLFTTNPFAVLTIHKHVEWNSLEPVSRAIRGKLSELGFNGKVDVWLEGTEQVFVCRNCPWPNLLRSTAGQVLLGVSVVGGALAAPYLWARRWNQVVRPVFKFRLPPEGCMDLISAGLHAKDGFRPK